MVKRILILFVFLGLLFSESSRAICYIHPTITLNSENQNGMPYAGDFILFNGEKFYDSHGNVFSFNLEAPITLGNRTSVSIQQDLFDVTAFTNNTFRRFCLVSNRQQLASSLINSQVEICVNFNVYQNQQSHRYMYQVIFRGEGIPPNLNLTGIHSVDIRNTPNMPKTCSVYRPLNVLILVHIREIEPEPILSYILQM